MKISVLGAGTWGTALTILLAENKHNVTIWSALPREVEELDNEAVRIGHDLGAPNMNYTIMKAQETLCSENKNFIMVSKKASGYINSYPYYYSDSIHLNQKALNAVGYEAGKKAGKYVKKQSKKK